uniref:Putative secreted protein n=1 Tax=Anopheles triannulatus TaxID=58253 RepID=A0A2M4B3V4_9DIPT
MAERAAFSLAFSFWHRCSSSRNQPSDSFVLESSLRLSESIASSLTSFVERFSFSPYCSAILRIKSLLACFLHSN